LDRDALQEPDRSEDKMKLIGNYMSPFVRRVAVSLNALDLPFELEVLIVSTQPEQVRAYNPVVRIPALILNDGEVLVDSGAILDEIDQMVGPGRALIPASGSQRRQVLKITAIAVATMEKAMWAVYERRFRPEEKVYEPWIERCDRQVLGGLRALDEMVSKTGRDGWLAGTTRLSQADITSTVAYTFADALRPQLKLAQEVPNLASFAARREEMPIFRKAPLPEGPR
jgi:glutathione S-transferase